MEATATKTVTNTHLAVATLAMIGAGALALAVAPVTSGGNVVQLPANKVCRPMPGAYGYGYNAGSATGVEIVDTNTGAVSRLTNGCRDAGHGMRNYTLTCLPNPNQYNVRWVNCGGSQIQTGTLQVSVDTTNPSSRLYIAGTNVVTLGAFSFTAAQQDVTLESITLTSLAVGGEGSHLDYGLLYLVDAAGRVVASIIPTNNKPVLRFDTGSFVVRKDAAPALLYIKADLTPIGTNNLVQKGGHMLGFQIAAAQDVVASGLVDRNRATVGLTNPPLKGSMHYMFKAVPALEILPLTNVLTNGINDLMKFRVTAYTNDIGLYKFTFDINTTSARVTNVELLDITDSTEVSLFSAPLNGGPSNPVVKAYFNSTRTGNVLPGFGEERTVSKNRPRTFVLRGTVMGVTGQGASISTRLLGDEALLAPATNGVYVMRSAFGAATDQNGDFVWSDRSLGFHTTSTADWGNGYLVNGLNPRFSNSTVIAR